MSKNAENLNTSGETCVAGAAMPAHIAHLDRSIRIWLNRDEIAVWVEVATAAGYKVAPAASIPVYPANPIGQRDEE